MRVGDLVRLKKVAVESYNSEDFYNWLGVVVDLTDWYADSDAQCVMVQWVHYDTPSPEYCEDLEVI